VNDDICTKNRDYIGSSVVVNILNVRLRGSFDVIGTSEVQGFIILEDQGLEEKCHEDF